MALGLGFSTIADETRSIGSNTQYLCELQKLVYVDK